MPKLWHWNNRNIFGTRTDRICFFISLSTNRKLVRLARYLDEPLLALADVMALMYYYFCIFLAQASFVLDQTKLTRLRCDLVLATVTLTPGFIC